MHDYDNNTKLDGLELLKSMTHFHDDHEDEHKDEEKKEEGIVKVRLPFDGCCQLVDY